MDGEREKANQKGWTLTQTAFQKLLAQFSDDDEIAAEQYLILQKNLIRFFENRGLVNPEEMADEVFNRIAKKVSEGEIIEKLSSYALGIARFVALEYFKKPQSVELPENFENIRAYSPFEEKDENEANLKKIEYHLSQLSVENRKLILRYYTGDTNKKIENRKRIAQELGLQPNALTKKITRLREKIEKLMLDDSS